MSSYYSLSSILSTSSPLPSTFAMTVPHLGVLDSRPGEPITASTTIDLPLYLASFLAIQRLPTQSASQQTSQYSATSTSTAPPLTLDLPTSLSPRVLNALKANPKTVDLRQLAGHFYESAERVLELFEEDELVDVLVESFRIRAGEIAHVARNSRGGVAMGGGDDFLRGLDDRERMLFRAAHDGSKAVRAWMGEVRKS